VGVVLDFDALCAEARARGGEVSFRKLLRSLADNRPVVHATCFVDAATRPSTRQALLASGFTVVTKDERTSEVLAEQALGLAARVDALVLAPASPVAGHLLDQLAATGIRLEAASFDGTAPSGTEARRLGRECMFIP
jgi:hypothetical protein